jgi:hypothetical protein
MIVDEFIDVKVNSANIKNLEEKGYEIPKYYNKNKKSMSFKRGTIITIRVSDLTKGSRVLVKVACDYCLKEKLKPYTEYNKSINTHDAIKKYCCEDCDQHKRQEIYEYKQRIGLLKRGNKGYWNFKDNILFELDKFIKRKQSITNMQRDKIGATIEGAIKYKGLSIDDLCRELEYDPESLRNRHNPPNYYYDFNNLSEGIKELIEILDRFPKQREVLQHLHISNEILLSFGGIKEIKSIMGYNDENDLIDNRGFRNASTYEYMVAQYLIENNVSYKREQYPFKGKHKRLRSDFTFYLEDDKEIHIEIWGYSRKDKASKRSIAYNEKRVEKERLYKNYNHILVGIDYEIFQGKYDDVQYRLYDIFNPYLCLNFRKVDHQKFIPANKISDGDLLKELMNYSDDNVTLPKQDLLSELGLSNLFLEAINRYGTYYNFAEKMGVKSLRVRHDWSEQKVYEIFDYMISDYGHILKSNELRFNRDRNLRGFETGAKKVFGSILNARISYYEHQVSNNQMINDKELDYIDDVLHIRNGFSKRYITEEILERLKNIIKFYNK